MPSKTDPRQLSGCSLSLCKSRTMASAPLLKCSSCAHRPSFTFLGRDRLQAAVNNAAKLWGSVVKQTAQVLRAVASDTII